MLCWVCLDIIDIHKFNAGYGLLGTGCLSDENDTKIIVSYNNCYLFCSKCILCILLLQTFIFSEFGGK